MQERKGMQSRGHGMSKGGRLKNGCGGVEGWLESWVWGLLCTLSDR